MSADQHPFVVWLVEHHGKDDNPLGDFAQELERSWEVPTSGGRAKLRESLEDIGVDEWVLTCFDEAWAEYERHEAAAADAMAAGFTLEELL